MPQIRWKSFAPAEPGRDYFAMVSYLPLKSYLALPKCFGFAGEVRNQLKSAKGLIGYALDAQIFRRELWTLSVWDDDKSMMDFVREIPHLRVMKDMAPYMNQSQFANWKVREMDLPLDWGSAKSRIKL